MIELTITDESHNQVMWQTRHPTIPLLVGVIVVATVSALLLATIPSPRRGVVLGGLITTVIASLAWLVWWMPLTEEGHLERTLDGGTIRRIRRRLWQREPETEEIPLPNVTGLWQETRTFEETGGHTYTLARIWALSDSVAPLLLTEWVEPEQTQQLGQSLAKAGRLNFTG